MKNCEVTIIQAFGENSKTIRYEFDDYRIAIALANILDNVSEPHFEADNSVEWLPILKKVM